MTKRQSEKINMYGTVLRQFETDPTILESLPALKQFIEPLKATYELIRKAGQTQTRKTAGFSAQDLNKKKEVAREIIVFANAMYSWGSHNSDPVVQQQCNFNATGLEKLGEPVFSDTCNEILKCVRPYILELAGYQLTPDSLAEIEAKVNDYQSLLPALRNVKSEKVHGKTELKRYFEDVETILNERFDKTMLQFKQKNQAVYDIYVNNRKLVRLPVTTTQIRGIITSADAPKGLRNVTVTVLETGAVKNSKGDGKFNFRPVSPGEYSLMFTAPGYKAQTFLNYAARLGQFNRLNVQMEKMPVEAVA